MRSANDLLRSSEMGIRTCNILIYQFVDEYKADNSRDTDAAAEIFIRRRPLIGIVTSLQAPKNEGSDEG